MCSLQNEISSGLSSLQDFVILVAMKKLIPEVKSYFDETAEELNALASMDQMEMYRMLTEIGNSLPGLKDDEKIESNFVQGCVSNVYIACSLNQGSLDFRGSSESHVVRGYVAILVHGLSGLEPKVVVENTRELVQSFAQATNIRATLTPSRANAFGNIYELMVTHARGYM